MESVRLAPLGIGSQRCGVAYYCDVIQSFINTDPSKILSRLMNAVPEDERNIEQDDAWKDEIFCLQTRLHEIGAEGYVVFEYNIIRMAKRIDVVLLLRNVVYSLEFKDGQNQYYAEDMEQALDYALRLKEFHKMSENLYVCPVLIATNAAETFLNPFALTKNKTIGLQKTNKKELGRIIRYIDERYGSDSSFDFNRWFWSDYNPSPNIVEAAVDTFNSVSVADIAHSEAGQEGIDACVRSVNDVIEYAKSNHAKCLCFVTGVPGAGKTLVGLDIAARHASPKDDMYSVYISGNGPLVDVLQSALAKSWKNAGKVPSFNAGRRMANILIQDGYAFRQACLENPDPPIEHVLVFDEAQRAWNEEQVDRWSEKRGHLMPHASEPELTIRAMDRHKDWAVIVCLVGIGQDIHVGEAGVKVWFESILNQHRDWEIFYANDVFGTSKEDQGEKEAVGTFSGANVRPELHLSVSVRSFRAEKVSAFVDELIAGRGDAARSIYAEIKDRYPIFVTRDIALAKKWALNRRVGSERIGLIASSTAKDAESNGINVPTARFFDWPKWFLESDPKDQGSSNALAFASSEFKIQGLEIDWAIVCWGADFRYEDGEFKKYVYQRRWKPVCEYYNRDVKPEDKARWISNAYRVILTRARQGMIICVPIGSDGHWDSNYHEFYEATYHYLKDQVGIAELTNADLPSWPLSKAMAGPNADGIASKLAALKNAYENQLITKEEYESKRKQVLENFINDPADFI